MDRQGIMLKFLVTLILAIIIFVPACTFASKILGISTQAKNNFQDFTHSLEKLSQQPGKSITEILILDDQTAVVYFEKDKDVMQMEVDGQPPARELWIITDYRLVMHKPSACTQGKNCLCLFREPSFDLNLAQKKVFVTSSSAICNSLDFELKLANCSLGVPHNINSYTCSDGFMIERGLVSNTKAADAYYQLSRRVPFRIHNDQGTLVLQP